MAEQPYYRPLESASFFEDGRASRPLERGVVHRGQYLDSDPLVTGLTREEWGRAYAQAVAPRVAAPKPGDPAPKEDPDANIGSPRYDPREAGKKIYAADFPFKIEADDLKRGQERYTIYCAVCHGVLGNGQGKIWERGYLTPTSFHTEKVTEDEVDAKNPRDIPLGYSRGYGLWGIQIPMRDVSVGYYFEVITKGYAGMPSYSAQIPPADRWRIIAYIRVLQLSQRVPAASLSDELRKKVEAGGKP